MLKDFIDKFRESQENLNTQAIIASGSKFEDPTFPATLSSLINPDRNESELSPEEKA